MAVDDALSNRVRVTIAKLAGTDPGERRMFGSLCFTIGGRICCCVNERGLLVKVDSKSVGQLLTQAGVESAQMARYVTARSVRSGYLLSGGFGDVVVAGGGMQGYRCRWSCGALG